MGVFMLAEAAIAVFVRGISVYLQITLFVIHLTGSCEIKLYFNNKISRIIFQHALL